MIFGNSSLVPNMLTRRGGAASNGNAVSGAYGRSAYLLFTDGIDKRASYPLNRKSGYAAILALSTGAINASSSGSSTALASLMGYGLVSATSAGIASSMADLVGSIFISGSAAGYAIVDDWSLAAVGVLEGSVVIGSQPSSQEIADNVWAKDMDAFQTEGTFGYQIQKLLTLAKFLGLKD